MINQFTHISRRRTVGEPPHRRYLPSGEPAVEDLAASEWRRPGDRETRLLGEKRGIPRAVPLDRVVVPPRRHRRVSAENCDPARAGQRRTLFWADLTYAHRTISPDALPNLQPDHQATHTVQQACRNSAGRLDWAPRARPDRRPTGRHGSGVFRCRPGSCFLDERWLTGQNDEAAGRPTDRDRWPVRQIGYSGNTPAPCGTMASESLSDDRQSSRA
jgi:hypothetical protein